jgi:maltooligosyltrehalose trehalohydrolase
MLAGDDRGYYADYEGTTQELADTLSHGWLYRGQVSRRTGAPRGTSASAVEMRKAIICVQNHDQIGNRALGDRLHHTVDPASWRAAIAVLLTAPMTPLLFMGQEWAASAPFQFFTDFEPELGRRVVRGRRNEFRAFPEFAAPEAARRIPDPQSDATFARSRLDWSERETGSHATVLALHRSLLTLRAENPELHSSDACTCEARALNDDAVMVVRDGPGRSFLVVARLRGGGPVQVPELSIGDWQQALHTEEPRFVLDPMPAEIDRAAGLIGFTRPGAIVFRQDRSAMD